jgi:hypothetical protein
MRYASKNLVELKFDSLHYLAISIIDSQAWKWAVHMTI